MWEVNRVITYQTWEDLQKAARYYESQGFKCEVRGWQDISRNKLTLLDDWEIGENKEKTD